MIWSFFQSKSTLIADTQWDSTDTIASPLATLSIQHKIPEISVRNQMERTISVRSHRNIWGCLWRWSSLTGPIISIGRTEMCLFISALFVSCLQITKRAVAWVGSVQPECTLRLGTWIFGIFKPKFCRMKAALVLELLTGIPYCRQSEERRLEPVSSPDVCMLIARGGWNAISVTECKTEGSVRSPRGPGNEVRKSAIPSPLALWKQALSDWEMSRGLEPTALPVLAARLFRCFRSAE